MIIAFCLFRYFPYGGMQKSLCKVTQGCAWYEQGPKSKCIEEGSQP